MKLPEYETKSRYNKFRSEWYVTLLAHVGMRGNDVVIITKNNPQYMYKVGSMVDGHQGLQEDASPSASNIHCIYWSSC